MVMIPKLMRQSLISQFKTILTEPTDSNRLQSVMDIIHQELPYYQWVGIYWLINNQLELGPYSGTPTEHTVIPIGKGVCGSAVADNENKIISDVRELDNYLACSLDTRSEIVVLIQDEQNNIIGQIDADGHQVGDFDASDETFLTELARLISASKKDNR